MILPRSFLLLAIAALAAASAGNSISKPTKHRNEMLGKRDAVLAEVVAKIKAAGTGTGKAPQLRSAMPQATESSPSSGIFYYFPSDDCTGNAMSADYFGTVCAIAEPGISVRFDCATGTADPATGKVIGEVQVLGFANEDCSGTPAGTGLVDDFVVGECEFGTKSECSAELSYGMNAATSLAIGNYPDDACDAPFYAYVMAYGCDSRGTSVSCTDGTVQVDYFDEVDCSGEANEQVAGPADVCAFDDDDNYLSIDSAYESASCTAEKIFPTEDDDDSAPKAMFSWFAALLASALGYALAMRA